MPDTLKQIYSGTINVTGLTGNQTATLFTNNATTRVVIKDVDVMNTFPVQPNLTVGGTGVAAIVGSLTGSEIVDASQAVGISFPTALSYSVGGLGFPINSTTYQLSLTYKINGGTANSVSATQTLPAQTETYSPATYYAPDGDVFMIATNGNDRWFLYKYAGGPAGTQTTVNTGNTTNYSCIAYDGNSTFYWLSSTTNLRIFNADTETTTNVTLGTAVSAPSTRSRLIFSNGYLTYISSDGNTQTLIEISTGRWVRYSSFGIASDQDGNIPGFYFDPVTRTATTMTLNAGLGYYQRWQSPVIPVLTSASTDISGVWTNETLVPSSFQGRSATGSSSTIWLTSHNGGLIVDGSGYPCYLTGIASSFSSWRLTLISGLFANFYWRPRLTEAPIATPNTTNFPSAISLRITGVEVTP